MKQNPKRVFLDTNILVNDFLFRYPQYGRLANDINRMHCNNALQFLRRDKAFKTYVASFSVARLVSLLKDVKVPRELAIEEIERLLARNVIVGLSRSSIEDTLTKFKDQALVQDLEDAFQYVVCRDNACFYLLTINTKDFRHFLNVRILHPAQYRLINY